MSGFSLARREQLLVERLGDEVVVYDQDADVAHCLSPSVAAVWEHADGTRSDAQIAQATGLSDGEVSDALAQLRSVGLLESAIATGGAVTRREAARRFARIGGAAFAAPLIYSVAVGPASAAASGCQEVTHSNGVGQTWDDCNPLGTISISAAFAACGAYAVSVGEPASICISGQACPQTPNSQAVCDGEYARYCWYYDGMFIGDVASGGCPAVVYATWG
jgi:hypothetical protein